MRLGALLADLDVVSVHGDLDREVRHVTRDSRDVGPDSLFVAIRGARVDGHAFLAGLEAVAAVVVATDFEGELPQGCAVVRVGDTKHALACLAAAVHGHPARALRVVGVTGTNGKTTVSTLVDEALRHAGRRSARIGTTGTVVDGVPRPSALTTPEAPALQGLFAEVRDGGVQVVVMEVSSIGLDQCRVDAIPFAVAVFTNLTRDHLDFHGTMDAYAASKARLFRELLRPAGGAPRALLCADDPSWMRMGAPSDRWLYGFAAVADVRILDVQRSVGGMELTLQTPHGQTVVRSPLVGRFNAQNLAAALGVLLLLGVSVEDAASALGQVQGVPGRLEGVPNERGLLVLVDYAHTPDALQTALTAVRGAIEGELWVVFGCGGDRDPGKRPEMGKAAAAGADHVVVTSDNPRSEDPLRIIDGILQGMDRAPDHVEPDRAAAIAWALGSARSGDAVLIAGKGHETYQEIGGQRLPFDDREQARKLLEGAV